MKQINRTKEYNSYLVYAIFNYSDIDGFDLTNMTLEEQHSALFGLYKLRT